MRQFPVVFFLVLATGVGCLYAWARLRSEIPQDEVRAPASRETIVKHRVTPEMEEASRRMTERDAPSFSREATDGLAYGLDDLVRRGPVVLTFIKDGCPCSESAQPFFNRLEAAYPNATFLGVIDVVPSKARAWAARFRVAYPLIFDPDHELVRSYDVKNSAYVVVVDSDRRIVRHWPGYSAPMLRELGALIARLSSSPERTLDVADAPDEPYTGCPFEW